METENIALSNDKARRAARILLVQKERLIQMLEDYFIRKVGRCTNIDNPAIPFKMWEEIADNLKHYGPSKSAEEWRKSFNFIKLRVKTKINNGSEFDHLLDSEQKIVNMFGKKWSNTDREEENDCFDQIEVLVEKEIPVQMPFVTIASDHDLETYLQEPYEIENSITLPDDHDVNTFEQQPYEIEDQTSTQSQISKELPFASNQPDGFETYMDESFSEDWLIHNRSSRGNSRETTRRITSGRARGRARGVARGVARGGTRGRTREYARGNSHVIKTLPFRNITDATDSRTSGVHCEIENGFENTSESNSMIVPIECELCGSLNGIMLCWLCNNQILCQSCDDMYHRHPKRNAHKRKTLPIRNPVTSTIVRSSISTSTTCTAVQPSHSISTSTENTSIRPSHNSVDTNLVREE